MKTPREILLQEHQNAGGRLDRIRESAVSGLGGSKETESVETRSAFPSLGGFIASLRWHFAGLTAAWVVILVLNSAGNGETKMATGAVSRETILASVVENRRLISELTQPADASGSETVIVPVPAPSRRRSELSPPAAAA